MPDVPSLGQAHARQRAAEAEPEEASNAAQEPASLQIVHAATAFLVAWIDGQVIITADLNAPIVADHFPTQDEILGAAANLIADRSAERTAHLSAGQVITTLDARAQEAIEARVKAMQEAQDKELGQQLLAAEQVGKRPH